MGTRSGVREPISHDAARRYSGRLLGGSCAGKDRGQFHRIARGEFGGGLGKFRLPSPVMSEPAKKSSPRTHPPHVFQAPTGTRDFYPSDLNRLRYIQDAWRRVSINHGFEEIDGPTFEHLDLYTVKSGEGIVSELFSFERFGGEKTFALRPEFTPTLARMYAAKAASLPKPTKWFWTQNCFRAERPQRGRLREFYQWNCDIIGTDSEPEAQARADAECIACCVGALDRLELSSTQVRIKLSDRRAIVEALGDLGVAESKHPAVFALLDRAQKMQAVELRTESEKAGVPTGVIQALLSCHGEYLPAPGDENTGDIPRKIWDRLWQSAEPLIQELNRLGIAGWVELDASIVRGLAYYTGMVFEVHEASGAERAIAGGGRYDGLIEMFGGPPTPAVGFGMGDVVLSLVLQDKGLMPTDETIADRLGLRPDALVVSNGTPEADASLAGVIATLRRAGLHARRSYKTSKNIGKLIQDAAKARARFCVILESAAQATLKNMETQAQEPCALGELAGRLRR